MFAKRNWLQLDYVYHNYTDYSCLTVIYRNANTNN